MARANYKDPVQSSEFILFDLSSPNTKQDKLNFSNVIPRLPLTMLAGASTCDAPELTLSTERVKTGIYGVSPNIVTDKSWKNIVIGRGVYLFDNEFYSWVCDAGDSTKHIDEYRRTVLLVWYHKSYNGSFSISGNSKSPVKAWILHDVLPVRYKAGSGFNALSSELAIQEIELSMQDCNEISYVDLVSSGLDLL